MRRTAGWHSYTKCFPSSALTPAKVMKYCEHNNILRDNLSQRSKVIPNLIIVRLHPVKITDGPTFRNYLNGLTITVFGLSFGNGSGGIGMAGTIKGLADPHILFGAIRDKRPLMPKLFVATGATASASRKRRKS